MTGKSFFFSNEPVLCAAAAKAKIDPESFQVP
jgi:hypothetical protein